MVTSQFLGIGSSGIQLQDIKACGENTSDNVYIQTLDAYGRTGASYGWNDWAAESACWVNDDYEPVEGVSFAAGQGLWVQGLSKDQSIQTSGSVGTSDIIAILQSGCTAIGNPFPIAINLQDIVASGEGASDNVYIQTLDAYGRTSASYGWNDWAADKACWVNDDYEPVEGVSFAAGQGLWVQGTSQDQSIVLPAPEL